MACVWSRSCCHLGLASTLAIGVMVLTGDRTAAQLTPDTTLGPESSSVTQDVLIRNILSDRIDGGARRGSNLFHSFLEFNVPANRGVYFTNPVGVTNILTRVTGGNQSLIDGRLGVDGGANLYLLNPNGIVFGPGASLDVAGSFIASTANAIAIGPGQFSATDPTNSTLLDVEPGALFLNALASQQAAITNQANLTIGQNLSLVAGSIDSSGQLAAPNGQITLNAVTGGITLQTATAQAANLVANTNLTAQNLTTAIAILQAGNDLQVTDLNAQTANLTATNNLTVTNFTGQTATFQSGNDLQVTDLNAQTANLTAGNNLTASTLTAQTANLTASNNLTATTINAQTATLTAFNNLTAQTVTAPNATLTASRDLLVQTVNATNANLIAGNNLTAQTVTAPTTNLTAGNNLTVQAVDATNATLSATGILSAQTVNALATATLTANTDLIVQAVNAPTTTLTATRNLTASNVIAQTALLNAGNDLVTRTLTATDGTLNAGNNLVLTDSQLTTTNNLNLLARGDVLIQDSVTNPFTAQVGGNLTIQGDRGVSIQALNHPASQLQSSGNLTLSSNGTIATNARMTSGAGLSVTSGSDLNLTNSQFNATGNVVFTAQNQIQTQDSLANPFTINAGGTVQMNGRQGINLQSLNNPNSLIQSGGNLTLTSDRTIAGSARLGSGANIDVSAGDNLNLTANQINATGNITLVAQNTVQLQDSVTNPFGVTAGGNLRIQGNQGITIQASTNPGSVFQSAGNLELSSNGAVVGDARFSSGGSFTITTGSDLTLSEYSGSAANFTVAGDITIGTINTSSSVGNGGLVNLSATRNITVGSINTFSTAASGNGGTVDLAAASGNVTLGFLDTSVIAGAGGSLNVQATAGTITTGLLRTTSQTGNGGSVALTGLNGIFANSAIMTTSQTGNGGGITLTSTRGPITAIAGDLNTSTIAGAAGNVRFSAAGPITTGNITTTSQTGTGGNIGLTSSTGAINTTGGDLNASAVNGSGGNVTLAANGNITTRTVNSSAQTGTGGAISLTSSTGAIDTRAGDLNASTINGNGGGVILTATGDITTSTVNSSAATGDGGAITVESAAGAINTTAGNFNASAVTGNGGGVSLRANRDIVTGTVDASSTNASGGSISLISQNGSIDTRAGSLNSFVITEAGGSGGTVTVQAPGDIWLASIRSDGGQGEGGDIQVTSDRGNIAVIARQEINSSTYGTGRGGDITLRGANNGTVWIDRSYVTATTENSATGNGGDINIIANAIILSRTDLDASTASFGRGGNVSITALNNGTVTLDNSRISTTVREEATGAGGNIGIVGGAIAIRNNSTIRAGTSGAGPSGNIAVNATGNGAIDLNNSTITSDTSGAGAGGNVTVTAPTLTLSDHARINARTLNGGEGGSVFVTTNRALTIANNSRISTAVELLASGNGGDITIVSPTVSLLNGGRLEALTRGPGAAGNIQITASDQIDVSGVGVFGVYSGLLTSSETSTSGTGGNITINSSAQPQGTLRVANGAFLSAGTYSNARGGNINVNVNRLELTGGGQLITSATSGGDAGDITVNATQSLTISGFNPGYTSGNNSIPNPNGSGVVTEQEANDTIASAQFLDRSLFNLTANPNIEFATTIPHLTVNGSGNDTFDYFAFSVETPDTQGFFDIDNTANLDTHLFLFDLAGNLLGSNDDTSVLAGAAGSIDIVDSFLSYNFSTPGTYILGIGGYGSTGSDGGQTPLAGVPVPTTSTYQLNLSLNSNPVVMPNEGANSGLFAQSRGSGTAGNLTINTPQLALLNGAQASVNNSGTGDAGTLTLDVRSTQLDNARVTAETSLGGGGNIKLQNARNLRLTNNSVISASTVDGRGGTLSISTANLVSLNSGSGLFARSTGNGSAGSLTIATPQLTVQNGSQIAVSSAGNGNAGNLNIFARNVLLNNGSRLVADTVDGAGGNIQLVLGRDLTLRNGAEISTSSSGDGTAGRILVQANSLYLTNSRIVSRSDGRGNAGAITFKLRDRFYSSAGEVSAASEDGGGGNITIGARDILLENSSLISTRVSKGRGVGGNIDITASAIFKALEDSDILANAEDGNGGRISITAPVFIADIFANVGPNPGRDFSRFRGNGQVDISASSRFGVSGVVSIPDFSFIQGSLSRLSENFVTPDQIVAGSCLTRRNVERGSFIAVGTGGLPDTPYNLIRSRYKTFEVQPVGVPGNTIGHAAPTTGNLPLPTPKDWQPGDPIQEAQGFVKTLDGRVILGTDAQLAQIIYAQEIICGPETPKTSAMPDVPQIAQKRL